MGVPHYVSVRGGGCEFLLFSVIFQSGAASWKGKVTKIGKTEGVDQGSPYKTGVNRVMGLGDITGGGKRLLKAGQQKKGRIKRVRGYMEKGWEF